MNVVPPISVVIIGAPGSPFLMGSVSKIIELIVSFNWSLFGFLWGVQSPFKNLAYDGMN